MIPERESVLSIVILARQARRLQIVVAKDESIDRMEEEAEEEEEGLRRVKRIEGGGLIVYVHDTERVYIRT